MTERWIKKFVTKFFLIAHSWGFWKCYDIRYAYGTYINLYTIDVPAHIIENK